MARSRRYFCSLCDHCWFIDIDLTGEQGFYVSHGCNLPRKRKFSGYTFRPCLDFKEA